MRELFNGFLLPRERGSQDRILLAFASEYCAQNKAAFESPNTAFVLAREFVKLSAGMHTKPVSKVAKKADKSVEEWVADVLSAGMRYETMLDPELQPYVGG